MNYQQRIESLLLKLPSHYSVMFAIYCCNDVKHLMNKEGLLALELTEKWLANNDSVTADELRTAANAARAAATVATVATAARAAAYAAADAAADARTAAAHAAAYAATATATAVYAAANKDIKYYYDYLVKLIANLTDLEKELFNLGELK